MQNNLACTMVSQLLVNNFATVTNKIALWAYWGHEIDLIDLSGSCDVIGHVTIWYPICHFLLVVLWNQASIINGFRAIQRRM